MSEHSTGGNDQLREYYKQLAESTKWDPDKGIAQVDATNSTTQGEKDQFIAERNSSGQFRISYRAGYSTESLYDPGLLLQAVKIFEVAPGEVLPSEVMNGIRDGAIKTCKDVVAGAERVIRELNNVPTILEGK